MTNTLYDMNSDDPAERAQALAQAMTANAVSAVLAVTPSEDVPRLRIDAKKFTHSPDTARDYLVQQCGIDLERAHLAVTSAVLGTKVIVFGSDNRNISLARVNEVLK